MSDKIAESYWQRGFNDGFANLQASPPNHNGRWDRQNDGYYNGWSAGRGKRSATILTAPPVASPLDATE